MLIAIDEKQTRVGTPLGECEVKGDDFVEQIPGPNGTHIAKHKGLTRRFHLRLEAVEVRAGRDHRKRRHVILKEGKTDKFAHGGMCQRHDLIGVFKNQQLKAFRRPIKRPIIRPQPAIDALVSPKASHIEKQLAPVIRLAGSAMSIGT